MFFPGAGVPVPFQTAGSIEISTAFVMRAGTRDDFVAAEAVSPVAMACYRHWREGGCGRVLHRIVRRR
ncbi:MAG: hypothetical protein OXC07_02950, partial [Kistimonas sp.]|nr:hypothetical protein [Kistimonas sp.]